VSVPNRIRAIERDRLSTWCSIPGFGDVVDCGRHLAVPPSAPVVLVDVVDDPVVLVDVVLEPGVRGPGGALGIGRYLGSFQRLILLAAGPIRS